MNTNEYEAELQALSMYASNKLDILFKDMLVALFNDVPEDPVDYMIEYLQEYQKRQQENDPNNFTDNSSLPVFTLKPEDTRKNRRGGERRTGISAEPVNIKDLNQINFRVIPKSEEQKLQIHAAVSNNILFNHLDDEQMNIVSDAMELKTYKKGDWILKQGDDGDYYYVVQNGTCDCYVQIGDTQKMVKVYTHGESFGELALMYNCPRGASIQANGDDCALWALDRQTFRKLLMTTTSYKRTKYEEFLENVPLLSTLRQYERTKIADALIDSRYKAGEYIVKEGDTDSESFYILAEGRANVLKLDSNNNLQQIKELGPGDFFGEVALLLSIPRTASIVASTDCRVVSLDRASFERLLGPCIEILKRDQSKYKDLEDKLQLLNS